MIARWHRPGDEAGFSLVEAMVAALVLVLFSTGVAALIGTSLRASKSDKQRVAATNLASRELEITRNSFRSSDTAALALVNAGTVTNPDPLDAGGTNLVDGTAYTVKRSAEFAPTGTASSACDGGSAVTYPNVRLGVEVTWPDMGSVKPVRVDSIITPSKRVLDSTYAFVAVKVLTQAGALNPGRTVKASGPGGTTQDVTDDSGCAVIGIASPGSYTVTLNEAGFVDNQGNAVNSRVVAVNAGSFQAFSVTYDRSASAAITLKADLGGYGVPSPLPYVAVGNPAVPNTAKSLSFASTGSTTTVSGLAAYTDGWTVFPGGCSDADPTRAPTSGALTPTYLAPGTSTGLTGLLASIDVNVRRTGSTGTIAGVPVTATKVSGATCSSGQSPLNLGTTDGAGNLKTSLPYGGWVVSAGNGSTSVAPNQSAAAQTVQVNVS